MRRIGFAAMALVLAGGAWAQGAKKPVGSVADLPRYTYPYRGDVARLITEQALLDPIVAKAKSDVQATLDGYAITDRTTLRQLHQTLAMIAQWQRDYPTLRREVELARSYADKPLDRQTGGNDALSFADAAASGATPGTPAFTAAYARGYAARLAPLPWSLYGDRATENVGRDSTLTRNFLLGDFAPLWQPQVTKGGTLNEQAVASILRVAVMIRDYAPMRDTILASDRAYVTSHREPKPDIWPARTVTLNAAQGLHPVVVAIWDGGFDVAQFPGRVWTNPRETANGRDDDGNGWVDDLHGVGVDENGQRTAAELQTPPAAIAPEMARMVPLWIGYGDAGSGRDTARAREFNSFAQTATIPKIDRFFDAADFIRGWYHGSHVAGIVADGNPAVRLMSVRRDFAVGTTPRRPTEATARAYAQAYKDQVAYMKAAGVRVANMSWTVDIKTEYEDELAANGLPATERAAEAQRLFVIEAAGLEAALKSAPDILFLCAAGNSNNSAAFQGSVPASFTLPNVLTIGAVGQDGAPTSFTSLGPTVALVANGNQIDSVIPGGEHVHSSGTSMASPAVANAAAKLLAIDPRLSTADVRALLLDTATLGQGGLKLLNPQAAVTKLRRRR